MTADGETGPTDKETVAVVVTAVRDGIMQGRYAPGQRLPEADPVSMQNSALQGGPCALRSSTWRTRGSSSGSATAVRQGAADLTRRGRRDHRDAGGPRGALCGEGRRAATADDRARLRELGAQLTVAVENADIMTYTRVNQLVHHAVRDIAAHSTAGTAARPAPHAERALPLHRRAAARPPGRGAARAPRRDRDGLLGRPGSRPSRPCTTICSASSARCNSSTRTCTAGDARDRTTGRTRPAERPRRSPPRARARGDHALVRGTDVMEFLVVV